MRLLLVAVVLAISWARGAQAAVVGFSDTFVATDFLMGGGGSPPPVATVTGSFTITFDTAFAYVNASSGLSFTSNIAVEKIVFTYNPANKFLFIGGDIGGAAGFLTFHDDLLLVTSVTANGLSNPGFVYERASSSSTFQAQTVTLSDTTATAVPEPASLALLGLGAAGAAAVRSRRTS